MSSQGTRSPSLILVNVLGVLREEVSDALLPNATSMDGASAPSGPVLDQVALLGEHQLVGAAELAGQLEEVLHRLDGASATGLWHALVMDHRMHAAHGHAREDADLVRVRPTLGDGAPPLDHGLQVSDLTPGH